ncbi:unnamed protein product [Durusdinium trenchii]|uniref:Uncharacterized protein n=1 Tax=Durusdinium trenchii TaxID=1381693 RepID=A0ABP0J8P8_9DINO
MLLTVESICTTSKLKRSEQSIDSPDFTHMRWRRIVSSGCLVTGAGTSDGSGLGSFEKPIFRQSQVLGELVEPHSGWRATADAFNLFWGILWWQLFELCKQSLPVHGEDRLGSEVEVEDKKKLNAPSAPLSPKLIDASVKQPVHEEPSKSPPTVGGRVAVMVVGRSRLFSSRISRSMKGLRHLSHRAFERLSNEKISSPLASQLLHVLEPLKTQGFLVDYVLCADQVKEQHPAIVEAWSFEAKDQRQRIQQCLRLVLAREIQRNVSYEYFVRLRPDLLVLTDLPNLEDAVLGRHCILARLRAANNIMDLTNEHLSWCYCDHGCCSRGALKGNDAMYIMDDMITIAAREPFLRLWQGREHLDKPLWLMAPMAETSMTMWMLRKGVPLCPLAIRALPLGSGNPHAAQMSKCGYVEGSPPLLQSHVGGG